MSGATKGILEAAMKLDPREREEFIEELSASLAVTDLDECWETEIKRRIEDVDSGRVNPVPAGEAFDRLEQSFQGESRLRFNPDRRGEVFEEVARK